MLSIFWGHSNCWCQSFSSIVIVIVIVIVMINHVTVSGFSVPPVFGESWERQRTMDRQEIPDIRVPHVLCTICIVHHMYCALYVLCPPGEKFTFSVLIIV